MKCVGLTHCSKCGTPFRDGSLECEYCKSQNLIREQENNKQNETNPQISEEELKAIWQLTRQGIDLEELEKVAGEIQEILKPVFELYIKNVKTYLKYKK